MTLMPKAQLLCTTSAGSNLGERVLDEVEKDSYITLPGKGRHSGFLPRKTIVPTQEDLMRSFMTILPKGGVADKIRVCAGSQVVRVS